MNITTVANHGFSAPRPTRLMVGVVTQSQPAAIANFYVVDLVHSGSR
jgi:hypothetical protein